MSHLFRPPTHRRRSAPYYLLDEQHDATVDLVCDGEAAVALVVVHRELDTTHRWLGHACRGGTQPKSIPIDSERHVGAPTTRAPRRDYHDRGLAVVDAAVCIS